MELFRSHPSEYRSSHYETKRTLIKSRSNQRNRANHLRRRVDALETENQQLRRSVKYAEEQLRLNRQLQQTENATCSVHSTPPGNPLLSDLPIRGHQFAAKMIALCINLAKQIGFRPARRALQTVLDALRLDIKVPSHDAIRNWTCRVGVGELENTFHQDQDVLWMADHSSQIGTEKVLLIIGIAVEDLPQPGQTLSLENVKVLAIVPGQRWKKEDVAREYKKLAKRIGAPRYLLSDGAIELREPAESLEKDGRKTIVLGDLKHHAANVLEKQIGRSDRFKEFISQVGLTRNRVQQTELSHFVPPPLKQKSRFMNLEPLLRWAAMVNHHLGDAHSKARVGITADRMNEKLGWLRDYRDDLTCWGACQKVIDTALSFINSEGLSRDTSDRMRGLLDDAIRGLDRNETTNRVAACLVEFAERSERQLEDGERAWLSTEILESLFGQFKQLEGQHSKGGFTSLLAALPSLCCRVDAKRVRSRLLQVPTTKLKQWVRENIGQTLTARRAKAYHEYATTTTG
ncbi:MAG TPA: hypothetical protein QF564_34325 [Pirellulaceae bacterium]|jgi:hypothetical protein|nr:hypothetical protein [Pirellulaceae bacterium]|tara:strand:- start:40 stop:1590 length:1551 start_codon:yes stop_codon:yes gene_type:complete